MICRRVAPYLTAFVIVVSMSGCSTCGVTHFSGRREVPKKLPPGGEISVVVPARSQWTSTGVVAKPGEKYRFLSLPPDRWYDLLKASSSGGYLSFWFQRSAEKCRRVPSAPWFILCGSIEPTGTPFVVKKDEGAIMLERGEIGLFANDVPRAYWNNFGHLKVRITRLH